MKKLVLACLIAASLALSIVPALAQLTLVYSENFDNPGWPWTPYVYPGVTWSWRAVDGDPDPFDPGRVFGSWNISQWLVLNNLPAHDYLVYKFDLIIMGVWGDGWDGYYVDEGGKPDIMAFAYSDSPFIGYYSFSQYPDDPNKPQSYPSWHDGTMYAGDTGAVKVSKGTHWFSEYPMQFTVYDTRADLAFYLWHDSSNGNERFMLDNFEVYVGVIPEPSSFAALGAGLLGILGLARRKR